MDPSPINPGLPPHEALQRLLEQGTLTEVPPDEDEPHLEFWSREGSQFERTEEYLLLPHMNETHLPLLEAFFSSSAWTDPHGNMLVRTAGFPQGVFHQGIFETSLLELLVGQSLRLPDFYQYRNGHACQDFLASERLVLEAPAGSTPNHTDLVLRRMTGAELVHELEAQKQRDLQLLSYLHLDSELDEDWGWQVHLRERQQDLRFQPTLCFLRLKGMPEGWHDHPSDVVRNPLTLSSWLDPEGEVLLVPFQRDWKGNRSVSGRPSIPVKRKDLEDLLHQTLPAVPATRPDPVLSAGVTLQEALEGWISSLEQSEACRDFMRRLKEGRRQHLSVAGQQTRYFYLPASEVRQFAQGPLMQPDALRSHLIQQCLLASMWQEIRKGVDLETAGLQGIRRQALWLTMGSWQLMAQPPCWAVKSPRRLYGTVYSPGYLVGVISAMKDPFWEAQGAHWNEPELLVLMFLEVEGEMQTLTFQVKLGQMMDDVLFGGQKVLEQALQRADSLTLCRFRTTPLR